jgi:hypothetical protein
VPEGAWATNLLGLTTQVPAKIIDLTDGSNNARPKALAGLEGKIAERWCSATVVCQATLPTTHLLTFIGIRYTIKA